MRLRGGSTSVGFQWNKDGSERLKIVEIAGTWDGWVSRHKLSYTEGHGWTGSLALDPGRYEYKFILDDSQWTHSEDEPKQVCAVGVFNNVLQVADPITSFDAPAAEGLKSSAERNDTTVGSGGVRTDEDGQHAKADLSAESKSVPPLDASVLGQMAGSKGDGGKAKSLWENTTPWHAAAVERAAERKRAEEVEAVYKEAAELASARKATALEVATAKAATVEQVARDAAQAEEEARRAEDEEAYYRHAEIAARKAAEAAASRKAAALQVFPLSSRVFPLSIKCVFYVLYGGVV